MKLFGVENLLIECIGTDSVKLGIQQQMEHLAEKTLIWYNFAYYNTIPVLIF